MSEYFSIHEFNNKFLYNVLKYTFAQHNMECPNNLLPYMSESTWKNNWMKRYKFILDYISQLFEGLAKLYIIEVGDISFIRLHYDTDNIDMILAYMKMLGISYETRI